MLWPFLKNFFLYLKFRMGRHPDFVEAIKIMSFFMLLTLIFSAMVIGILYAVLIY